MPATILTLISKPGCHLCDEARAAIETVLESFPAVRMLERSILDDDELHARYWDEIPVVLLDDVVHTIYRVDVERLRAALATTVHEED